MFNCHLEQIGNLESQRQRRVIFAGLDGVHTLSGNPEPLRKIGLRPVPFRAQNLEPVLHARHRTIAPAIPNIASQITPIHCGP